MQIALRYFEGCANWQLARSRLEAILDDTDEIQLELVDSYEDAERLGFRGSPTILINGEDPFADESAPVGFACRMYRTETGIEGAPSVAQLRRALKATA